MRFLKGAKQQMSHSISALPVRAKVKDTSTTYYGVPIIWEIGDLSLIHISEPTRH